MLRHKGELCQVCKLKEKNYQCPSCKIKYCSIACFKEHKSTESEEKPSLCQQRIIDEEAFIKAKAERRAAEEARLSSMIYVDEKDKYRLPVETLETLRNSGELRDLLCNPHLRNFLTHVDTTHSPQGFMKMAMQEPLFVEFADACLKAIHPEENQDQEMSLDEVHEMVKESIQKDLDDN